MIVLLGGSGYVGQAFQKHLTACSYDYQVLTRSVVDYTHLDTLKNYLRQARPEFLINAAGYTGRPNVDACELHKTECLLGNAVLPGTIRQACEDVGIPWGHVSSGCIYTGTRADGTGFTEEDAPNFSFRQNNCSFYSGCKALGEEVLQGAENSYTWRLRIPFNEFESPRNYITKMMRYDRLLNAVNSLSHLDEFVAACTACWTNRVPFGTFNLTNPGCVSTKDVIFMIRRYGLTTKNFDFFETEEEFMRVAAKTPRSNCVLDTTKAEAAALPMSPVEEALDRALRGWKSESCGTGLRKVPQAVG